MVLNIPPDDIPQGTADYQHRQSQAQLLLNKVWLTDYRRPRNNCIEQQKQQGAHTRSKDSEGDKSYDINEYSSDAAHSNSPSI